MQKKLMVELSQEKLDECRADWRAGLISARAIAIKYGVSLPELQAWAEQQAWEHGDLRGAINREATRALVERTVSEHDRSQGLTQPKVMDSAETVRQYGQIVAAVTEEQRKNISRARRHTSRLFTELEELAGPDVPREALEGLAAAIAQENPDLAKMLTAMHEPGDFAGKLNVLNGKAAVLLKLANSMKLLVDMERAAFGLDKPGGGSAGYDELVDELLQLRNGRLLS